MENAIPLHKRPVNILLPPWSLRFLPIDRDYQQARRSTAIKAAASAVPF
jgi:hypothetical protein